MSNKIHKVFVAVDFPGSPIVGSELPRELQGDSEVYLLGNKLYSLIDIKKRYSGLFTITEENLYNIDDYINKIFKGSATLESLILDIDANSIYLLKHIAIGIAKIDGINTSLNGYMFTSKSPFSPLMSVDDGPKIEQYMHCEKIINIMKPLLKRYLDVCQK